MLQKFKERAWALGRDFFKKIVVVSGFKPPQQDESGIIYVGVIPFLLEETFLED